MGKLRASLRRFAGLRLAVLFTPRGAMISVMKSSFPSTVFCVYIWLYFSLNGCRA